MTLLGYPVIKYTPELTYQARRNVSLQFLRNTNHIYLWFSLNNRCFCESICYFGDFYLKLVPDFCILYKNYKTLYSSNSTFFSADFHNVYLIFLAYFDRFWSRRTSVEASTTTATITPASAATRLWT